MIDFCLLNNLIITHTFYQHKNKQKYTREAMNRREKLIIDYFLLRRDERHKSKDVKVKRGPEMYVIQYMVKARIQIIKEKISDKGREKINDISTRHRK